MAKAGLQTPRAAVRRGGVRANAEKAGPRVRAVKRRTFAIEVRLPEDAAAARLHRRDRLLRCPRSASSEICCCSQSMFGVPACIGNREITCPASVWVTKRVASFTVCGPRQTIPVQQVVPRIVDIPFVDRAAAQRGATDIQRPAATGVAAGSPVSAATASLSVPAGHPGPAAGETAAAVRSAPSRSSPPRTSCRSAD